MQVYWVAAAHDTTWHTELDDGVGWEGNKAAARHEVLRVMRAAQDLQENRNIRRNESSTVYQEASAVLRIRRNEPV